MAATIVAACAGPSAEAATLDVREFGAVGDGRTDDGPAIRRAVDAAIRSGRDAKLVFQPKTYRLGPHAGQAHIVLTNVEGLSIEGNGATLIMHPRNGILTLWRCRNVTFRGFLCSYDPLPFTQGTIHAINAVEGTFDLSLHDGYPPPPADDVLKKAIGPGGWEWGSVIDPKERHRRWDVADHFAIDSVNRLESGDYRIRVAGFHAGQLAPVRAGDRFFLPLALTDAGERIAGGNVIVTESADCAICDVTLYNARSGMDFTLAHNPGRITLRNDRVIFKPGGSDVCTSWKDGVHCKDNRVGPLIEGCTFEGMLDDSINISANTAMAAKVISPTEFALVGAKFSRGDEVMVFDPVSGRIVAETTVSDVKPQGTIVLAAPVDGVVVGQKRANVDIKSTHFYNMSWANRGFIIRNCTFGPQRRHAMLIRSSDGLIEGNTIDSVGGSAVAMCNEIGSFYEGPFPHDNIIRGNNIRNAQRTAIEIYTASLRRGAMLTHDIKVLDNTITVLSDKLGITVKDAERVELRANRILDQQGKELGDAAVRISP